MSAREYEQHPHTVLYIDTLSIIQRYAAKVELTHMNTGATQPYAHPRGRATFRQLRDYPYAQRKSMPDYSAIVELTALNGVPDVLTAVRQVESAVVRDKTYMTLQRLYPE